jgi:ankyrin repeat protein
VQTKVINQTESRRSFAEINKQFPLNVLTAHLFFKLALFSSGKALYTVCADSKELICCPDHSDFPLHRAVFEGNIHFISRYVTGAQEGVLYTEKNQLDHCGNTALTLAVQLGNTDAVKVLTDFSCSAKLNSLPGLPSPFELAYALKERSMLLILMESVHKLKQQYLE